jgi:hypothetical protein
VSGRSWVRKFNLSGHSNKGLFVSELTDGAKQEIEPAFLYQFEKQGTDIGADESDICII